MKVLVACEFSGTVRQAFATLGHDAWSCDILPTEIPGKHIQGDVLEVLSDSWDLMIAHPPCTYLCNSGVRWLYGKDGMVRDELRWDAMRLGAEFFKTLLNAPIPLIAVENPVMHKYAKEIIGANFTQTIQPYEFGHPESKRTALWLRGLPPLKASCVLSPTWYNEQGQARWDNQTKGGSNKLSPSPDRWKLRSKTYEGLARAMAEQWSKESFIAKQISMFP